MKPRISIITATSNLIKAGRKEYFLQCIESVRMQDYDNFEHIVIDNSSTDGSLSVLKKYSEKGYFKYFSEKDTGIYNAYNKGIAKSSGDYIAFLNSDDFYTRQDAFTLVMEAIEREKADFSCADFKIIENHNKVYVRKTNLKAFPLAMPFAHPSMFSSKKMLNELGNFDESYSLASDFDLINRAFFKGYKVAQIDIAYVSWRRGGVSDSFPVKMKEENIQVLQNTCNLSKEEAEKAFSRQYLPKAKLLSLLGKVKGLDKKAICNYNKRNFLKFIRRQILTLHLGKGRRTFKLFGINFYKEVV